MKPKYISALLFIILYFCLTTEGISQDKTKIAFGSCSKESSKTQLWNEIASESPRIMILTGDNIYGDTQNMALLKQKYDIQKQHPDYQNLIAKTKIIGIWDDHDYGINDGGKYFAKKDSSKLLMLDFLDVPINAEVRNHDGAYSSYKFTDNEHIINIILLDTRYFRDTIQADMSGKKRYLTNENGDILGEQQWKWLENELNNSKADINIVCSSIQVLPTQHAFEKWSNFPKSRERLLRLIGEANPKNTIIISGDRHIAELSKKDINGLDHSLYDFTSSGLTHTWSSAWEEKNDLRIGEIIRKKNYGLITIDWNEKNITFEVKGQKRKSYFTHSIPLY